MYLVLLFSSSLLHLLHISRSPERSSVRQAHVLRLSKVQILLLQFEYGRKLARSDELFLLERSVFPSIGVIKLLLLLYSPGFTHRWHFKDVDDADEEFGD